MSNRSRQDHGVSFGNFAWCALRASAKNLHDSSGTPSGRTTPTDAAIAMARLTPIRAPAPRPDPDPVASDPDGAAITKSRRPSPSLSRLPDHARWARRRASGTLCRALSRPRLRARGADDADARLHHVVEPHRAGEGVLLLRAVHLHQGIRRNLLQLAVLDGLPIARLPGALPEHREKLAPVRTYLEGLLLELGVRPHVLRSLLLRNVDVDDLPRRELFDRV